MTDKDKKELEKYRKAAQQGYIKRCKHCGSLNIYVYTDEDYFTDMTRARCADCKHEYYYREL